MYILPTLFKIFLFIWIIFIPMKTFFYPLSYVFMVIIFLVHLFRNNRIYKFKEMLYTYKNILIAFLLIIISMTISNISSPLSNLLSWHTEFNYMFRYLFIFLILSFLYKEKFFSKKFILISILSSLLLQATDGIYQAIFHYDFIKHHVSSTATGLTGAVFHRNPFGMFMAIGASISFGLVFYYKKFELKKMEIFFLCSAFTIFIFNLLFSYSRASWLFFLTFLVVLLVQNYKKLNRYHIGALISILALVIIVFLDNEHLLSRFNSLINANSSHRFAIWTHTINLAKERILLGHGLMTFASTLGQIKIGGIHHSGVHNSILEIFLFLGLFGLIAYTFLLWNIFKRILLNQSAIQLSLFFAFLVITQFDQSVIKGIIPLSSLVLFAFFIFSYKQNQKLS